MTSEQTRKSQGFRAQPAEHHGEEHDAARQVRIERPSPQLEGEAHSADQKGQQQHGPITGDGQRPDRDEGPASFAGDYLTTTLERPDSDLS